jgi:hypothetical protein
MNGSDFPGDDLSGVRAIAFRNVFICAVMVAVGLWILSSPTLPQESPAFLLGLVLGGGGFLAGIVYALNFLHVCIWTYAAEREYRDKLAAWEHRFQQPIPPPNTTPLLDFPRRMTDDELKERIRRDLTTSARAHREEIEEIIRDR